MVALGLVAALLVPGGPSATALESPTTPGPVDRPGPGLRKDPGPGLNKDDKAAQRLTRQTATIALLRQAIENNAQAYGGLSVHGPTSVVIHLTGATIGLGPELARLRDQALAEGIHVRVDRQRHSLAELKQVENSIRSSRLFVALGRGLVSFGIDPDANAVEVGVTDVTPELVDRVRGTFGDTVRLVRREPVVDAWGRLNDVPPFYGGDRIWGSGGGGCTFGFTVTDFRNNRLALTAGHCWPVNTPVRHNEYSFGTVIARSVGNYGVDSEFTWYPGLPLAPRIWVGGVYGDLASVPVHGAGDSCNGCQVYTDGASTGQKLAFLEGGEACYNFSGYAWDCHIQKIVRAPWDPTPICQPGDSGGPVFAYNGFGGVTAVGIIKGVNRNDYGICYYTKITNITSFWGVTVTTESIPGW